MTANNLPRALPRSDHFDRVSAFLGERETLASAAARMDGTAPIVLAMA